jgi:hypothetical protein
MADLSALGNLQSTEPLDLPIYKPQGTAKPFPVAGRYTARVRDSFPAEAFGASKTGYLTVKVDPTIIGGPYDGYTLRNTSLSAKTWTDRDTGKPVSQIGRFLKACGINQEVGGSPQQTADAVEQTANTIIQVDIDWLINSREHNFTLKGMKNFPVNEDGSHSRFVTLDGTNGRPSVTDPSTGKPVTLRAFLEVTRFVESVN